MSWRWKKTKITSIVIMVDGGVRRGAESRAATPAVATDEITPDGKQTLRRIVRPEGHDDRFVLDR